MQTRTSSRAASKFGSLQLSFFAVAIHIALFCSANGCGGPSVTSVNLRGKTMGTTYSVKYVPGDSGAHTDDIGRLIEAELASVNAQMSTYISTSEVSRFNKLTSTEWFDVSPETAEVVALALEVSQVTGGAFDVTVGPLVNLWGFGPDARPSTEPTDVQLREVLSQVGYKKLHVRVSPPSLQKDVPGLEIDLSAIAKGHGVDRVAAVLAKAGVDNYFVEIGGEVVTRGTRTDGKPWQVGIELPNELEPSLHSVVGLSGEAMATSGDYRNFYELSGKRFSHTIDPTNGRPFQHQLASASVIADNCAFADALATSMMALGPERGKLLADEQGWKVLLLIRDGNSFRSEATPNFPALVSPL